MQHRAGREEPDIHTPITPTAGFTKNPAEKRGSVCICACV